jgi:hypothetical protein
MHTEEELEKIFQEKVKRRRQKITEGYLKRCPFIEVKEDLQVKSTESEIVAGLIIEDK